jgi:hypothetical protein
MIHAHFRKDLCHGCGVGNIGMTGASALAFVSQGCIAMGCSDFGDFLFVQIGEAIREGVYGRRGCDRSLLSVRSKLRYKE